MVFSIMQDAEYLPGMIEELRKHIAASAPVVQLTAAATALQRGSVLYAEGISGSLMAFAAAQVFDERKTPVVLLVPEKNRAEQLRDDCALLLGESLVHLYAAGPSHAAKQLDMSAPVAQLEALRALAKSERIVVVATAEALTAPVPAPSDFTERTLELSLGPQHPFEGVIQKLIDLGFEKKDFVEEYGDFAVRGGILDIFPMVGDHPLRFEFWGDTIESIREFDVLSQRSIRELQTASIVASIHENPPAEDASIESREANIRKPVVSLFSYLAPDTLLIVDEPILIEKEIDELLLEGYSHLFDWSALQSLASAFPMLVHSMLAVSSDHHAIGFQSRPQPPVGGSVKQLVAQIQKTADQGCAVYLSCDSEEGSARLNELIEEEVTAPGEQSQPEQPADDEEDVSSSIIDAEDAGMPSELPYVMLPEAFHSGFVFPAAQIAVFTEHEIFGRVKRRGTAKRKRFKGITSKELQQLRRGDFVVHQDYGIGRFAGLQKIQVRGVEAEVMKLVYEGEDSLYVHMNFINRVQKYSSQEGHTPKLSKLGGQDWDRLKARARKKIKDIARDLIALYARRKHERGFAFAPDTHWQKEMEASFLYEDTPDQATATGDVKLDMQQDSPMDRLICGDVGFGKTEVAVRAAFKAVMNGKQVAVLVPTTILAEQHFHTFMDRVARYSVRVESLSRFRPKPEQKNVVEGLKDGKVDIVIGTHRLLSKDIAFKDLGLLIIDEEQRFGVAAKEKLRQLRASVDTLTLTATPIPRTLQFSLMGARDLSLINTPPRNRIPIQTEIAEFDLQVIREAIMKELHRGGQVYFVHDRVHNIDLIQRTLEEHVPKARFHSAHGQMKGHELERAMVDFMEKKYDVLLCTKIIESGIDIPSVNTIIINRADHFGLAELYQLRGRVGRSNVQAYAYLLTPPLSVLPRQTLRRLQAIQEFTELGSGFNLAMRDLEIRGAGNLLGGEQSGFILEMGFEMYQRVVEEAVAELKEEEFQDLVKETPGAEKKSSTVIETDIEALIPDFYIEHDGERLDIYRRLYRSESMDELHALRAELQDRFGEYPEEVENLFCILELKIAAALAGFIKVELAGEQLTLHFPPPEQNFFYEGEIAPFQKMMGRMPDLQRFHPHLKQDAKQLKLLSRIPSGADKREQLHTASAFVAALLAHPLPQ